MPQAVAAIGTFIGGLLVKEGALTFLGKVVGAILLSTVSSKLFGPKLPSAFQNLSAISVTRRSAVEYRRIVYGQAILSGPVVYNNLSGDDGEYLWYVIALADHESDSLVSVYLDQDEIPIADIGGGTGNGDVSTSKWVGDNSTEAVYIRHHLGSSTQVADSALTGAFTDWTSDHRLRGVTYIVARLLYNADTEEIWSKNGQPRDYKAVIKGRKIYDPRLDTTNGGSGSHRYSDSTTWEWSDNPALCVADYLTQIMGVDPATGINWTALADAADDCDVSVDIPTSSTETRFTCNGALSLGSSHKENLDKLLSSMDGRLAYSQGQWTLRASVWEASSVSLTADHLAGDIQVRGSAPKSERFNTVRGVFVDPDRNYEVVEFPHVTSSSYVTRDNGDTISFDLELPMTNSATMAQRIAYRQLEQGDNQLIVELPLKLIGANIAPGDVFDLTLSDFSWSAKTFRCVDWARNTDGTFKVVGRVDESGDYTDPLEGEYAAAGSAVITVPSDVVPAPSNLTASGEAAGNRLTWINPPSRLWDWIDVYASSTSAWGGASLVASVRSSEYFHPLGSAVTRYYWIRARRVPSSTSIREPDTDTTTVSATTSALSDGADGTDGTKVEFVFQRSSTKPATPTGNGVPSGWFDDPPSGSSPLWMSEAEQEISGTLVSGETWSEPVRLDSSRVGNALNNGRQGNLLDDWYADGAEFALLSTDGNFSVATGTFPVWGTAIQAVGSTNDDFFSEQIPIDRTKKHRVSVWARQPTGDRTLYLAVAFFADDGTQISNTSGLTQGTGWGSTGTYHYWQRVNQTVPTDWTLYTFDFGGGAAPTIPADAVSLSIGALVTRSSPGTTETTHQFHDYHVVEVADDGDAGADGSDGADGDDGLSVYTATVFRRSASAPSTPTGGSYNFTSKTLTPPASWSINPPASDGNPLYVSQATFSVQGATGTDGTTTWSSPQLLVQDGADGANGTDGADGADGSDGISVYTATVFRRAASAPSTPTGGSYNFGTNTLTPPSGWSINPPASDGNPLYASTASFSVTGPTGIDSSTTWASPELLVQDGEDGANGSDGADGTDGTDGLSVYTATIYRRSASAPATPTGGSYNFGTKVLTPPTNWSQTIPSGDNPLYTSVGSFSVQGTTGIDSSTTWSTPGQVDSGTPAGPVETSSSSTDTVSPATALVSNTHASNGNRITVTFSGRAGWSGSSGTANATQVTLRLRRRIDGGSWVEIASWTMPSADDPSPATNAYNQLSEVLPEDAAGTSAPDYPANGVSYFRRTSISSKILWWVISGSLFDNTPADGEDVEYELVHTAVPADNGTNWNVSYSIDTAEAGG